jgi:YidC/Oxa1 family membrane protein insertase
VFIGLFQVLRSFNRNFLTPEENRATGNYVFSAVDVQSFLDANLFGVPLSSYITESAELLARYGDVTRWQIAALAVPLTIVAGILTHLTAKHSVERQSAAAQAANPQAELMNKLMLYLFPLGVVAGGPFFPVAILIYWLSNNLWTLAQQRLVYNRIDAEEAEQKETAVAQRQALAPRPGQKPVRAKKETSSGPPAGRADSGTGSGSESEVDAGQPSTGAEPSTRAASNGVGSTGSSRDESEEPANGKGTERTDSSAMPGMIQQQPRARKKTNRKRR